MTRASLAIGGTRQGEGTQSHRTGVLYSVTVTPAQILAEQKRIKRQNIEHLHLQYRKVAD